VELRWHRARAADHDLHGDLHARVADGLVYVAAEHRMVGPREAPVQVRERLAVDERKSSGEGACLERTGECGAALFPLTTAAGAELDFGHGPDAGQDGGVDLLVTGELDQAANELVARLQYDEETEIRAEKRHVTSGIVARRT
jgi:hypothetical protein